MRISRPVLDAFLREFSDRNGVIVGAPGIGKSHSLKILLLALFDEGDAAIPVVVTNLLTGDQAELKAIYGYFEDDFVSYLRRQGKHRKRRLIAFDGYDAARDPAIRARIIHLIRRCIAELPDWQVLVSVREYDARHSADLLGLFPGTGFPGAFGMPGLPCRHFYVPTLTPQEIEDSIASSVVTAGKIHADQSLFELLKVPFNLLLLERIAESRGNLDRVTRFDYQAQLLHEYWGLRVEGGADHLEVAECLRDLVRTMVESHSLSVPLSAKPVACASGMVKTLQSEGVLTEAITGSRHIGFSHNILFDYAVQSLLLDEGYERLAQMVERDETLALLLRPSFSYYFARLWATDRNAFWAAHRALSTHPNASVRFVGKLVPASAVAENARHDSDLEPLLGWALSEEGVAATRSVLLAKAAITVPRDDVWLPFLADLSAQVSGRFINELARRSKEALDRGSDHSLEGGRRLNEIGRNLLRWCMAPERDPGSGSLAFAGAWVLPLVLETYRSCPDESRETVGRIVGAIGTPGMSIDLVYRLCAAVSSLFDSDPGLASLLYEKVFQHEETSIETTQLARGVLTLTSNRAQDYGMSRYSLAVAYGEFLRRSPRIGVAAGLRVLSEAIGRDSYSVREQAPVSGPATLLGTHFEIRRSYRGIRFGALGDNEEKIADALFGWLGDEARTSGDAAIALGEFATYARDIPLYESLLLAASKRPDLYAKPLVELCVSPGILGDVGLTDALGTFIETALPRLSGADLSLIEEAILAMPSDDGEHTSEFLDVRKASFLSKIPVESRSSPAEELIARVASEEDADCEAGDTRYPTGMLGQYLSADEETKVQRLPGLAELEAFNSKYRNESPDYDDALKLMGSAREVSAALQLDGPSADHMKDARTAMAGYARRLIQSKGELTQEDWEFASPIIMHGAMSNNESSRETPISRNLTWTPSPEIESAGALPALYSHRPTCEIHDALQHVMRNGSPAARYQLAATSLPLSDSWPDLFWQIARSAFEDGFEQSRNVSCHLSWILRETEGASEFARWAIHQIGTEGGKWPGQLSLLVAHLAFVREREWARSLQNATLNDMLVAPVATRALAHACLQFVYLAIVDDDSLRKAREAARAWLVSAVAMASEAMAEFHATEHSAEQQEAWFKEVWEIVDSIAERAYFNTTMNRQFAKEGRNPVNPPQQRRMFLFVLPLLRAVSEFRIGHGGQRYLVPRTAHYIAQILSECVRYAPSEALAIAHGTLSGGMSAGYSADPMALTEASKLIEELLANHRDVLAEPENMRLVRELLEMFIEAGSEEAMRLVWRLDEIFR